MYIKAEYIPYIGAYRLYVIESYTIAYVEHLEESEKEAKRLGYDGVILVDEEEINC